MWEVNLFFPQDDYVFCWFLQKQKLDQRYIPTVYIPKYLWSFNILYRFRMHANEKKSARRKK
jgi:hypothetical protein